MHSFNQKLQSLAQYLYKGFYAFGVVAFSVLLLILLFNVFARNLLNGSVAEIEEGSRFIFTWMMFLGVSIGIYHKKHLGVVVLVEKYPPKIRKMIVLVNDVLMIVFFLILVVYGLRYSMQTMGMRSPVMGIPYGLVYLCIPLCGVFSLFYAGAQLVNDLCGSDEKGEAVM